jgi:hypothetical protein
MYATNYGGMDLPVPSPATGAAVSDPALDKLLAFLKATINARAATAWNVVATQPGGAMPVVGTFAHDPKDFVFNDKRLPALFLFREDATTEQIADDYEIARTNLTLLWVPPDGNPEALARRSPFVNAIDKVVSAAMSLARDPSWVDAGDTDPLAATQGSFVWMRAGLWRAGQVTARSVPLIIDKDDQVGSRASYPARRYTIPVEERVVNGGYDEFEGVVLDMQTIDDPPFVTNSIELLPLASGQHMPKPATLHVVANPYCALDADGEPSGVAYRADLRGQLVGALIDHKRSKDGALKYEFSTDALPLPDMPAHRVLLRTGQILPADAATARVCGIGFTQPSAALAAAKERAALEWLAAYGELPPFAEHAESIAPAPVGGGS